MPTVISLVGQVDCDRPAVISTDQVWTYDELMDRAADWARQVAAGELVEIGGVVRAELIPMLLGCWLSGAAYRLVEGDKPPHPGTGQVDATVALVDGDLLVPHRAITALTDVNLFDQDDTVLATDACVVGLLLPLTVGAAVTVDDEVDHTVVVADRMDVDPGVRVVLTGEQSADLPENTICLPGPDGAPWGLGLLTQARRSLGQPVPGRTRYVLGSGGDVVPVGAWGELWVDGPSGVLDDPRTTADRCRPDPYGQGARIYATGLRVQFHGTGEVSQPWPRAPRVADETPSDADPGEFTIATLSRIWTSVLGVPAGPHDDFFELGGDSLLATQIVLILRDSYDVDLRVWQLLEAPTLAQLAEMVELDGPPVTTAPRPADEGEVRTGTATYAQDLICRTEWLAPGVGRSYVVRIPLTGTYDPTALITALAAVIERHDALRCTFRRVDGTVEAVVDDRVEYDLRETEVSDPAEVARLADELLAEPFDLTAGPLVRVLLAELGERHEVLVCVHEAVFDRWSAPVLRADFEAAYQGRPLGAPSNDVLNVGRLQRDRRLDLGPWERLLTDPPLTAVEWPGDGPVDEPGLLRAMSVDVPVRAVSERQYLAAFARVLRNYCPGDPTIAVTTDDRARFGLGPVVGSLTNTRFMRLPHSDDLLWIPVEVLTERIPVDTGVALQAGFAVVPNCEVLRRAGRWDADVTLELRPRPVLSYRADAVSPDTAGILAADLGRTLAELCVPADGHRADRQDRRGFEDFTDALNLST
jgi:acyl carrier protein